MSRAVPRSGCLTTIITGVIIRKSTANTGLKVGGEYCLARYDEIIMGTATFINSEGCTRVKPKSSQRCAPLAPTPKNNTASSNSSPKVYSRKDQRSQNRTGNCATVIIIAKPTIIHSA